MARTRALTKPVPTVAPASNEPENLPRYVWLRGLTEAIGTEIEKLCEVTIPSNLNVNIGAGLKSVKRLRIDADTVITTNEVQVYHEQQTRTGDGKVGNFEIFIAPTVTDPERIGQLVLQGLLECVASKDTMQAKESAPWRLQFIDVENEKAHDADMKRWTKLFGLKRVEHAEGKHVVYEASRKTKEHIEAAIRKAGGYEHARIVLKDPAKKKDGNGQKKADVNRQVKICCPRHLSAVHAKSSENGEPLFRTAKDDRGHPVQKPVMEPECELAFRASREKYDKVFGPKGMSPIVCKVHRQQVIIDEVDIAAIEATNKSGRQMVAEKSRTATKDNARVRTRRKNADETPATQEPAAEAREEPQQPFQSGSDGGDDSKPADSAEEIPPALAAASAAPETTIL